MHAEFLQLYAHAKCTLYLNRKHVHLHKLCSQKSVFTQHCSVVCTYEVAVVCQGD